MLFRLSRMFRLPCYPVMTPVRMWYSHYQLSVFGITIYIWVHSANTGNITFWFTGFENLPHHRYTACSHSTIGKGWRVYKCTLISRIAQKAHPPSRSFHKKEELTSRQNKRVTRARLQIVAARRRSPGIAKICEPALVLRHIILYAPRGLRYGCCRVRSLLPKSSSDRSGVCS